MAARKAPDGPLRGAELERAIEVLTDRQLRAYRYRREGNAWNWIAHRLGVTRPRVVHLVAAAEKRLGYEPSVTPKQKAPYKPVAQREQERESAIRAYVHELWEELEPHAQERFGRILETAESPEEEERLLREWLAELQAERRTDENWSRAVGEAEAEFEAEMEATYGTNPMTGETMRPEDLPPDSGGGYDRL